ncbi:MAG: coproporphyrinogen dehydrogenase HemZ [Lachnospiraceae bacterium]|nr:coproporphyrinogen dehydrogenase HemZ [Lachnospiraceae bacterium]
MIQITTDSQKNTYTAYNIGKAFYPEEEVKVNFAEDGYKPADVYLMLQKETGRDLPWGMLTGVRPTKLSMEKVQEGMGREEFIRWFRENRFVSEEKAGLAYDVAKREWKLVKDLAEKVLGADSSDKITDTYSLYVNIPFCPTICTYCSFSSGAIADYVNVIDDYLDCVIKELDATAALCKEKKLLTIYIGGGTPTTLTAAQLERLLKHINEVFIPRNSQIEFTLEAGRPDTITKEKLEVAKKYGVTRISINPQTMQDETLKRIGRKHEAGKIKEAMELARACGFDNINMDLIMGLPQEGPEEAKDTLEKVAAMKPDCLTVHSLSIKRTAEMAKQTTAAETVEEMLKLGAETAKAMDMEPYYLYRQKGIAGNFENTGYATPGKECLYNILIMEEIHSILAVGAGASTKLVLKHAVPNPNRGNHALTKILRCENVSNISEYIARIDEMIERKENLYLIDNTKV